MFFFIKFHKNLPPSSFFTNENTICRQFPWSLFYDLLELLDLQGVFIIPMTVSMKYIQYIFSCNVLCNNHVVWDLISVQQSLCYRFITLSRWDIRKQLHLLVAGCKLARSVSLMIRRNNGSLLQQNCIINMFIYILLYTS